MRDIIDRQIKQLKQQQILLNNTISDKSILQDTILLKDKRIKRIVKEIYKLRLNDNAM